MKTVLLLFAIAMTLGAGGAAGQDPQATPAQSPATKAPATPVPKAAWPRYKPPVKDAPAVRRDGGTRGPKDPMPALFVLAPNHVALTTQEQPALFWYQSQPTKVRFEISVTEPNNPKPILALKAEEASKAGIRRVKLSDHQVTLKTGVEYHWSVSLVPDPSSHSRDVVASGIIKRVEVPRDLKEKVTHTSLPERATLYAQSGFWYDALQSLSELVEAHPEDHQWRAQRAGLLDQVKLPEPAAFDRKETKD
jgi:hypothetical protein